MSAKRTLSPRDLARAIGASESSLKRWADEGAIRFVRTSGGHRRIPISEAIRFIRASGAQLIHPDVLGFADLDSLEGAAPEGGAEGEQFLDYLVRGESARARGLLLWLYTSGQSIASLCDGPVQSAMASIGERWQEDETGIYIEHRATDICIQALSQLRLLLPPVPDGPFAVGGSPSGDPYVLPSIMAASVLAAEGFQTVNLGPETPAESMVLAARDHGARLVWLSISSSQLRAESLTGYLRTLQDGLQELEATLVIGGQMRDRLRTSERKGVFMGGSMSELAAFARGVSAGLSER
jgi:excisionase family DNA binding protein